MSVCVARNPVRIIFWPTLFFLSSSLFSYKKYVFLLVSLSLHLILRFLLSLFKIGFSRIWFFDHNFHHIVYATNSLTAFILMPITKMYWVFRPYRAIDFQEFHSLSNRTFHSISNALISNCKTIDRFLQKSLQTFSSFCWIKTNWNSIWFSSWVFNVDSTSFVFV